MSPALRWVQAAPCPALEGSGSGGPDEAVTSPRRSEPRHGEHAVQDLGLEVDVAMCVPGGNAGRRLSTRKGVDLSLTDAIDVLVA